MRCSAHPAAAAQGPSYQGGNCPPGLTCTHWCPGDPAIPGSQVLRWDPNVCHDWYWNSYGIVDVDAGVLYPWRLTGDRRQTAFLSSSTLFSCSHGSSMSVRPKCPYAAVGA